MKQLFLICSMVLLIQFSTQAQRDPSNEILVYFKDGIKQERKSENGIESFKQSIKTDKLKSKLMNIGISEDVLETAIPNFDEADTFKTLQSGEQIVMLNMSKLCRIKIRKGESKEELIEKLKAMPEVLYAEPNGLVTHYAIPSDTRFNEQWGLRNTINIGEDIHAVAAWDIYTGNTNNIIGIIDGGTDAGHNDLNDKVMGGDIGYGWDGHGIHVSGIAAAESNNSQGVSGVDWNAKVHAQRIDNASDDAATYQAIVAAVNYSSNLYVLNHSWGLISGYDQFGNPLVGRNSTTVREAFAYAYKANRTSVVAMGNHQSYQQNAVGYPAGYDNIITVGATTSSSAIASYSAHGNHIDVSAPGSGILSTYMNGGYTSLSGTSMATPHVSGIASLLKGYNPNLSNDDIENIIKLSSDDTNSSTNPGFDNTLGHGRVNAERALNYLRSPYVLNQASATGGTVYSTSSTYGQTFLAAHPSLASGNYVVKRKEVRKTVTFSTPICQLIGVWGRGVGSSGWSIANPNYGEGFVEVVPGTVSNTGATLRTYVYEVWNILGQSLGHYPTTPANVIFKYTVLGIPESTASITGASIICTSQVYQVSNLPLGATVTWSSSWNSAPYPTLVQNSPVVNQCTVNNTYQYPSTTTLTATITGANCGTLVLTKQIMSETNTQVQYGTYYQEACYFHNTSNPSSSGSLPTTVNTPLYLRQGCLATITLNSMIGKTVTYTGAVQPLYWYYSSTESKLYLQLPYMSGGIPFTFKITGEGACQEKSLLFFSYTQPYYPSYSFSVSPNPVSNEYLTISAKPSDEYLGENGIETAGNELEYSVSVTDLSTGETVSKLINFKGRLEERLDISKLRKGLYSLQIFWRDETRSIRFLKE